MARLRLPDFHGLHIANFKTEAAMMSISDFDAERERILHDQEQLDETDYKVVQWLVSEVMAAKAVVPDDGKSWTTALIATEGRSDG